MEGWQSLSSAESTHQDDHADGPVGGGTGEHDLPPVE